MMPSYLHNLSEKRRELLLRIVSALVMAPVAVACVVAGGEIYRALIVALGVGMAFEWRDITRRPAERETGIGANVWTAAGWCYVTASMLALLYVRESYGGLYRALFLAVCVWSTDVGAFFVGRTLGGPKLAPSFSPKKTWSGLIGGAVCSAGAAWIMSRSLPISLSADLAVLWGAGLAVTAQIGDIAESWVKRVFGVKDSGRIIPGHGGLLDRMDGLNAAAIPFALLCPLG
ncbi:MAG: phosphatidate cytidylyltransferase [Rickettsiales bacterium]